MLTSKLIKQLQEFLEKEGDLPVYIKRNFGYCEDSSRDDLEDDAIQIEQEQEDRYAYTVPHPILPKRLQID